MQNKKKIIVAVTGASGALYADLLMEELSRLPDQVEEAAVILSPNGAEIWKYELDKPFTAIPPFRNYEKNDFSAPFASGSSSWTTMVICPCSMGTLGRIANGISDDLITRAADVMLKERRTLILVPRETPYNLIHIENMRTVTLAGGIICPATPSYYSKPGNMAETAMTVVDRILSLAGIDKKSFSWGSGRLP